MVNFVRKYFVSPKSIWNPCNEREMAYIFVIFFNSKYIFVLAKLKPIHA